MKAHRPKQWKRLVVLAGAWLVTAQLPARADQIARPDVPDVLAVDDAFRLYLVGYAIGTQNYVCLRRADRTHYARW